MSGAPDRLEVDGLHPFVVLQRQRKIHLRGERAVALGDAGPDSPVFCHRTLLISFRGFQQIIERRVHVDSVIDRVSLAVLLCEIFCIVRRIIASECVQDIRENRVEVCAVSVTVAEECVLSLSAVKLVKGPQIL